jgi:hypothetical protein
MSDTPEQTEVDEPESYENQVSQQTKDAELDAPAGDDDE